MDNGSARILYDLPPYTIYDEIDFFAVDKGYQHIASFKKKEDAFKYVNYLVNTEEGC